MPETCLAGYSFTHYIGNVLLGAVHPSQGAYRSAVYQAFKVNGLSGAKYKLKRAVFYLKKAGSPTGHLKAVLYNMTGDRMADAKPIGLPLATSELVDIANLGAEHYPRNFYFDGSYEVETDDEYCIAVLVNDGALGGANVVLTAKGGTLVNGVYGTYAEGAWICEG